LPVQWARTWGGAEVGAGAAGVSERRLVAHYALPLVEAPETLNGGQPVRDHADLGPPRLRLLELPQRGPGRLVRLCPLLRQPFRPAVDVVVHGGGESFLRRGEPQLLVGEAALAVGGLLAGGPFVGRLGIVAALVAGSRVVRAVLDYRRFDLDVRFAQGVRCAWATSATRSARTWAARANAGGISTVGSSSVIT
jgi:hypothetical protein